MAELHFARYKTQSKFTHYLFRFPAKFHPPVVRCLIDRYSNPGDVILDPFCGSGTLLVEAALSGRDAIGIDVDPVATFISRVKSTPIDPQDLEHAFKRLKTTYRQIRRSKSQYDHFIHNDLSSASINRFRKRLKIPAIPNIHHWFRTYVALDLARLRLAIYRSKNREAIRNFFLACFASIIRNASNADPIPVSGLEVTAHMREIDKKGRRIDPFDLFERRALKEIAGMREFWNARNGSSVTVRNGDATSLSRIVAKGTVDVVITSPPYNTAVDYYRRHQLEMYWLNLVSSQEDRLKIAPYYLGRVQVKQSNPRLRVTLTSAYIKRLVAHAKEIGFDREKSVRHYCASMIRAFAHLARALKKNGRVIFIVGNSKWNGRRFRATTLLRELASHHFDVIEQLSYTTQNRYMSYSRHNGANVNREFVLVLKKRDIQKRPASQRRRGQNPRSKAA